MNRREFTKLMALTGTVIGAGVPLGLILLFMLVF